MLCVIDVIYVYRLDSFACNLRMNLVEVIVKGCCPAIESRPAADTRSATPIVTGPAGIVYTRQSMFTMNALIPPLFYLHFLNALTLTLLK